MPINLPLPAVIAGAVNPEGATGRRYPDPTRKIEQLQPVAEQHVILRHATPPPELGREGASLSRNADGAHEGAVLHLEKDQRSQRCRDHSETVQLRRRSGRSPAGASGRARAPRSTLPRRSRTAPVERRAAAAPPGREASLDRRRRRGSTTRGEAGRSRPRRTEDIAGNGPKPPASSREGSRRARARRTRRHRAPTARRERSRTRRARASRRAHAAAQGAIRPATRPGRTDTAASPKAGSPRTRARGTAHRAPARAPAPGRQAEASPPSRAPRPEAPASPVPSPSAPARAPSARSRAAGSR